MRTRPLVWSLCGILLVAVLSVGATVLTGTSPLLGLDLKGGVSVVEQPQGSHVNSTIISQAVSIIDNRINGSGIANAQVTQQGNDIDIEIPGVKNDTQVLNELGATAQLYFRPVECMIEPYLAAPPKAVPAKAGKSALTPGHGKAKVAPGKAKVAPGKAKVAPHSAKTTGDISPAPVRRTASQAAGHPEVAYGGQHFGLELAAATGPPVGSSGVGISKTTTAVPSASTAGDVTNATAGASPAKTALPATTVPPTTTTTSLGQAICSMTPAQQEAYVPYHGNTPDPYGITLPQYDNKGSTVVLPSYSDFKGSHYTPDLRYVLGPAEMTGAIVKSATAEVETSTDQWVVNLSFTGSGTTQFNNYAAAHYACYKQDPSNPPPCAEQAIELDGVVYSAPAIEAASYDSGATINGSSSDPFTSQNATDLANALNYGSLPVRFVAQDFSNVSPQIGTASLKAGAVAGAIAVLLVILYLLVYYRALGLVVVIGICMSGGLLYAITTLLSQTEGLTLTLSGVIGLIVSVGVTADSCVVYFERLKEEVRSGRTVRTSVEKGFSRAFRTILAADFSSFIAALILYTLTVGDVRGFAFFLGLATLLNVVTTYFFTRPLVILIGRRASMGSGGFLGVSRGLGVGS